jgi:hypothetical protein
MLPITTVIHDFVIKLQGQVSDIMRLTGRTMTDSVQMLPSGNDYKFTYNPYGWSVTVTEQMMRDAIEHDTVAKLIFQIFVKCNRPYRVESGNVYDMVQDYLGYSRARVSRSEDGMYRKLSSLENGIYFSHWFDTDCDRYWCTDPFHNYVG